MREWISNHQGLLWTAGGVSVVILIASVLVIPALVVRIGPDYFTHAARPPSPWARQHRAVRAGILTAKNLLGAVLILAGLAMLVLPGQGLLTVLVGVFLLDFPGKYRFEKWLVGRRWVHRPINWLRRRRGRAPLQVA